ncbi:MAG: MBL fold metallo-hydrolase [Candidatus Odinarchaeota archaeon]
MVGTSMLEAVPFDDRITCIKTASSVGDQVIMWVYAYHVEDALFDAGCANAIGELREYATKHPIRRVFVTHFHEDHYGGCAAFLPNAEIFARPMTLESIHKPYLLPQFFEWVWGTPDPVIEACELTTSTIQVKDFTFEVLDFSGHCAEMIGFWEPEQKWLFSADAVPLPSEKKMAMPEENIPKMITRMEEIQDLNPHILFDGHRGPIPQPRKHIDKRIKFLTELQIQVQELANKGKTISEIKSILGFPEPWYLPNTEERFAIEHLIRSLLEDED